MAAALPEIVRRRETEADMAFSYALFCDSRPFEEHFAALDPALSEKLLRHQFAGQAASYRAVHPGARRDIVEVGGTPIGRIVVDEGPDRWTIVDVAIATPRRNQGLGARLIAEVLAEAQAAGVPVQLHVMVGNVGATRLYRRLGFVTVAAGAVDIEMVWRPAL